MTTACCLAKFSRRSSSPVYAIVLGAPTNAVSIHAFGHSAKLLDRSIKKIRLLGSREKINWQQTDDALQIAQPEKVPNTFANVFKITLFGN
jgi:alpha-L-fucosidase